MNNELAERLIEDAAKLARHFVGVSRQDMLLALAEIRDIAEENLKFLPPDIAKLTAAAFVTAIAGHAAELEAQQGMMH